MVVKFMMALPPLISPSWMVGVIDCIVGELKIAFVREVRLGDEHDVYVL
jgi:hypothetical protein